MYEEVVEVKKKSRREWKLFSVTGIAVITMLFVIALFVGGYIYYGSYRTFVGEFSQTTSINYRKGGITVTTAEETFELAQDNIYYIYNCIVNAGRGRIEEAPDRAPDAVLEYEFGGRLELWNVTTHDSKMESVTGLFIRYTSVSGYEYGYDTNRLTMDRLPLTARQNKD